MSKKSAKIENEVAKTGEEVVENSSSEVTARGAIPELPMGFYGNPYFNTADMAPMNPSDVAETAAENPEEKGADKPEEKPDGTAGKSEFKGKTGGYFGLFLLSILFGIVTLGLASPWIICKVYRWEVKNKVIDGQKLCFDGKGIQLLGKWICWTLLTIITIGIYALWIPTKVQRFIAAHTHVEGETPANSGFDKCTARRVGLEIVNFLNVVFTLGLGAAWASCRTSRWKVNHRIVDGRRLKFEGKGIQLFGRYWLWGLLCVVTLGIFGIWIPVQRMKWETKNTHFADEVVEAGSVEEAVEELKKPNKKKKNGKKEPKKESEAPKEAEEK